MTPHIDSHLLGEVRGEVYKDELLSRTSPAQTSDLSFPRLTEKPVSDCLLSLLF
jgi:hypothetical protein